MRNLLEVHATDRTEARASAKRRDADTGPAVAGQKSAFSGGEGQYVRERTACADTILALRQRSYAGAWWGAAGDGRHLAGNYPSEGGVGDKAAWFKDSEGHLLGIGQALR
jgi:hypothetical protein